MYENWNKELNLKAVLKTKTASTVIHTVHRSDFQKGKKEVLQHTNKAPEHNNKEVSCLRNTCSKTKEITCGKVLEHNIKQFKV